MKNTMMRLWNEDEAANAVEYGLIAALIAVGLIVVLTQFRGQIANLFNKTGSKVQSAAP